MAISNSSQPAGSWFSSWRFAVFLGLAIFITFPKVMLGLNTFFNRDFGVLAYPMIHFHHECFWRGELPLWNPLSNCGAPFLAQWGTMALYPFSIFYLLLPLPWSLNFFCLAHLWIAGMGMYFLALRWVDSHFAARFAGTAFVFCGITLSCLAWPNYTVALGWMPWVVLWVERAWNEGGTKVVGAALISTMQMLSGVPEIVLLTWLLLSMVFLQSLMRHPAQWRGRIARILGIVIVTSGLMAAQLLPFFELLAHSQRSAEFATSKWSMPVWGWINLLMPLYRCFLTPQGIYFQIGQEFLTSTYVGITTLLLGLFAICTIRERRVWLLAGLAAFGLLISFGENGFLYHWIKNALPSVGFARYPIKFILLISFVLPLLAAHAIRNIELRAPMSRNSQWRILALIGFFLLLIIAGVVRYAIKHSTQFDDWPAIWRCAIGRALFLIGSFGLLSATASATRPFLRYSAQVALLVLVMVDASTHVPNQNPTLPAYALAPGLWEMQNKIHPPNLGDSRVLISPAAEQHLLLSRVPDLYSDFIGKRLALWSNLNLLESIPKVNGSSTLQIREQAEVQSLLYATTNSLFPHLADFLSASLVTSPGQIVEWTLRESCMPLVTGGQKPVFADPAESLRGLTNANFNGREVVYLPVEARPFITATNRTEVKITPKRIARERIELEVSTQQPSLIVVSQSFYPAWHAYIDERPSPIWRANHAFQTLEVPAGNHEIKFVYQDNKFTSGAAVSAATLLICGISWLAGRRVKE